MGSSSESADTFRRQVHGSADAERLGQLVATAATEIEARGTFCPEPVIRMQEGVRGMRSGQVAVLLADDAGVEIDIPAWCISTGNEYLGLLREDRFLRVLVRKT